MNVLHVAFSPTRNRRVNELVGLLLLVASLLLLLSLLSYTPTDPSLNTAGGYLSSGRPAHNWAGLMGAGISDLLLQSEGLAAFLLPILFAGLGWVWLRSRPALSPISKISGACLGLLFAPALFGLLPLHALWMHSIPLEGLVGRVMADAMLHYLNLPGACILALALVAAAIYLTTTFSLSNMRNWAAIRFAFVLAWRDRFRNWKRSRAERRQATLLEKQAAKQRKAEEAAAVSDDSDLYTPTRVQKLPDVWETQSAAAVARRAQEHGVPASFDFAEKPEVRETSKAETPKAKMSAAAQSFTDSESIAAPAPMPSAVAETLTIGERADASLKTVTVTPKNVHGFRLPPSSLLHRSEDHSVIREDVLRTEAKTLVEKYAEFDVNGQVVQINPGPVVTTFEFRPDAGVKYSRVTGLSDDLCLAMRAESILIERMAGKSTVGIQVPNTERETIWLRDVVESENFANSKSKLTLAMGKDINGRIVHTDLATMPHVLIAGSTGSGKSVAINAMIMSVLYKATPDQVRLILVDPKRVELGMYEGIPHLFTPIITEPKLAANALRNAVREMERRLKLLASRSVRNLDQYNKLFENTTPGLFDEVSGEEEKPLPFIIIIIDELADLMMLDKANVEESITRLAQMARAVGIHLVLATQRPSVDVITGLIKANVPTRISFRLATKVDSRTILDTNGAESLLGRGDMLFLPPGTSRLQRVHAPFVTEKEIAAVVEFWKAQGTAEYQQGFLESPRDEKGRELDGDPDGGDAQDAMFEDAIRLVLEFGKASTSLLQRRLRIGYGRAAHLIDMMERDGIVGPADGSKPREILKSPDWLQEVETSLR